jgi:hypothetical protein
VVDRRRRRRRSWRLQNHMTKIIHGVIGEPPGHVDVGIYNLALDSC